MSELTRDFTRKIYSVPKPNVSKPVWGTVQNVGFLLLALATFFNMADFVGDKYGNVLDLQVVIKLAICSCCGLFGIYGAMSFGRIPQVLVSFPGMLLLIIGVLFLVSVPFSVDRRSTFVSASLFWTVLLPSLTAMHCMGRENALRALATGLTAFVVVSWVVYFVYPELGVFAEALPGGQFQERMAGISHPNTLGIFSGVLSAILIAQGLHGRMQWSWIAIPLLLAIGAMAMSLSRTSMGAFLISTLVVNRHFFFGRRIFTFGLLVAALVTIGLFVVATDRDLTTYVEDAMERVSKSGDIDELTTGTGRSEIWAFAVEKTAESPFFGKGLATSKKVMVDYSGYTHNMWLNMFYSAGIFCGISFVVLTVYLLLRSLAGRNPLIDGVVLFLLINGVTENVVFSPVPSGPTIALVMATVWPMFARGFGSEDEVGDEDEDRDEDASYDEVELIDDPRI